MERERILIISHSYSPIINPRAFRWQAIAEKWIEQGLKVDVITSWLPGLKRFETKNGVEIHRVGGGISERLRLVLRPKSRATTGSDSKDNSTTSGVFSSITGLIRSFSRFINDKIWKNIYWPDYACLWIVPASSKAQELCEMVGYSSMISVSDPFSSHLAAKKIKSNFPEINWLVDIGDPFSFRLDNPANNTGFFKKLNFRKEREVFGMANFISVTNENTKRKYAELFRESSSKIKTISPIVNFHFEDEFNEKVFQSGGKTKLVYVGTLYKSIRNPEYLLNLFEMLSSHAAMGNLQLHFFGGYDDCRDIFEKYHHLVGVKIFLHGLVSHEKVAKAMAESDILVNIGNNNPYQLPSKLVEYVCLGKPILNLHTIPNDNSKEFLKEYPAVLNLYTHGSVAINDLAAKTEQFIRCLPFEISSSIISNFKEQYGIEKIASEYREMIDYSQPAERVSV